MDQKNIQNGTQAYMQKVWNFLRNNAVVLLFLVLSVAGYLVSGATPTFFLQEIVTRFTRNAFLVLALIIPVVAGIGLNFAIVIGAMAGQMGLIHTVAFNVSGIPGFLLSLLISTPLAILFGYLTGKVLNKTKGNEMIASMILGYLANGIYQFIYLILAGTVIPIPNEKMILQGGMGLLATCSLDGTVKYALDNIWKTTLDKLVIVAAIFFIAFSVYKVVRETVRGRKGGSNTAFTFWIKYAAMVLLSGLVLYAVFFNEEVAFTLGFVDISISTLIMIGLLMAFNSFIFKTKLGQDFRSVGHSQQIAAVSGINVDKTRIIAVIFSTVFAAWGQIIHLQNIGTINVYSNHEQVGLLAVAAILVGGATVDKANNKQAIIGVLLFHAMFAISPLAGVALFADEQVGEFFRVFISYGVIFIALALNANKNRREKKTAIAGTNNRRSHA